MKTTPLHPLHIQLEAKFTEFSGYQMPLQYSSIVEEIMEAGMPLYGHELSEDISPLMASLDRFVSREKDFLGKDEMFSKEPQRKLFGLELQEKGVPREGYRIEINGREIGVVSSGTFSPTLKKGIALCFVDKEYLREGTEVELVIREKPVRAVLRRYPFIK
jgi:aminomethyltransferase